LHHGDICQETVLGVRREQQLGGAESGRLLMGRHGHSSDLSTHGFDQRPLIGQVLGGQVVLALRVHLRLLGRFEVPLNLGRLDLELRQIFLSRTYRVFSVRGGYQPDGQCDRRNRSDHCRQHSTREGHSATFVQGI